MAPCSSLDVHLLVQTVLYLASVVCGMVVAIPLGTTTNWKDASHFYMTFPARSTCDYPVYLAVSVGILYAAAMTAYHCYGLAKRDPNFSGGMWVFPLMAVNAAATGLFLVAACIISVGFKAVCDSYLDNQYGRHVSSCADGQPITWGESNYDTHFLRGPVNQ